LGNFHFNSQDDALPSAMIPEPAASKILLAVCEERKLKKRDADIGTEEGMRGISARRIRFEKPSCTSPILFRT
jgi:hypothetical protein